MGELFESYDVVEAGATNDWSEIFWLDVNEGIIEWCGKIIALDVNGRIILGDVDGITLGLDDGIGSLYVSFDGSDDGKLEDFGTTIDGWVVRKIELLETRRRQDQKASSSSKKRD